MATFQLDDDECQKVLAIIATAPWNVANPLLMKLGEQLRRQQHNGVPPAASKGDGSVRSGQPADR